MLTVQTLEDVQNVLVLKAAVLEDVVVVAALERARELRVVPQVGQFLFDLLTIRCLLDVRHREVLLLFGELLYLFGILVLQPTIRVRHIDTMDLLDKLVVSSHRRIVPFGHLEAGSAGCSKCAGSICGFTDLIDENGFKKFGSVELDHRTRTSESLRVALTFKFLCSPVKLFVV